MQCQYNSKFIIYKKCVFTKDALFYVNKHRRKNTQYLFNKCVKNIKNYKITDFPIAYVYIIMYTIYIYVTRMRKVRYEEKII